MYSTLGKYVSPFFSGWVGLVEMGGWGCVKVEGDGALDGEGGGSLTWEFRIQFTLAM